MPYSSAAVPFFRVLRTAVTIAVVCFAGTSSLANAGDPESDGPLDGREGRELLLRNFRPEPMLRVRRTPLNRAKFPCVDVHLHPRLRLLGSNERLDEYVRVMDAQGIAASVSLDGGWQERLEEHLHDLNTRHPHRFVVFANIDWQGNGQAADPSTWDCHRPDFGRRAAANLRQARELGAVGLKLFKQFGLGYRNPDGTLIAIDDRRWDPIWQACGELGMPVIIHTADPAAFFRPIDETNERWEELSRHPDWSFPADQFPTRDELLSARNRVIARHPQTQFIGAHMANNSEDLATVGEWLETYPNLVIETAARIAELGRQPYTAHDFFLKYADRILFGTDGPRVPERLTYHWRLFETRDEYFPYAENEFPPQGLWRIYGLNLPDDVLRKLYYQNAARVIPGIREALVAQGIEP